MKIAPSVETLSASFPNKNHQIDSITGTPERLGLDILFEEIIQNAAYIFFSLWYCDYLACGDGLQAPVPKAVPQEFMHYHSE